MDRKLTVYFTSDTHGYLFPTNYADRADRPQGLLKLMAAFQPGPDTLIVDGGDAVQGSPFTYHTHDMDLAEHPVARAMNMGGYNFVTLGNHDFNYGTEHLARYLNTLNARCLCANIHHKNGLLPVEDSAVVTLENGLRVGLVGICTDYVKIWEKPQTLAQLDITDPFEAARRELEGLRGRADITVCLYHGGFEVDLTTGQALTDSAENIAGRICRELDFDVILCGHQHMPVPGVCLWGTHGVQPAANGLSYARVTVTVGEDGSKQVESGLFPPAPAPLAPAMEALAPLEARVQAWLDTPKGHLSRALPAGAHLDMALSGSLICNFVNQVQRQATGARLSATSLANEVKGFDATVTVRDVVATYVYPNTLYVLTVTGAVLRRYMERTAEYFTLENGVPAVSESFLRPKVEHYNYDYFSGVHYTFDLRRPVGSRLTALTVDGRPVGDEDRFSLCVNNYRASGTGGYEFLRDCPVERQIQTEVAELLIAYIEQRGDITVDEEQYITTLW